MSDDVQRGPVSTLGKLGCLLMALLLAAVMTTFSACTFGFVHGEELNPYTFDRRSFHYIEIPVIGFQVSPTTRTSLSGQLQDWIVNQQKLLPASASAGRWDVVYGRRAALAKVLGDAFVLAEYFEAHDGDGQAWLSWSKDHQAVGAELWPRVAWLAQAELYYRIPALMDTARRHESSASAFVAAADKLIAEQALETAAKLRESGEAERAAQLERWSAERPWAEPPPTDAGAEADGKAKADVQAEAAAESEDEKAEAEVPAPAPQ